MVEYFKCTPLYVLVTNLNLQISSLFFPEADCCIFAVLVSQSEDFNTFPLSPSFSSYHHPDHPLIPSNLISSDMPSYKRFSY